MIRNKYLALQQVLQDFWELSKPRVVALMLVTVVVGMLLAPFEHWSWAVFFSALFGISFSAGSAAAINHLLDCHLDAKMQRTQNRPVVQGRVTSQQVLIFAFLMALLGEAILYYWVNPLTAGLTFLSLIGYAVIYTGLLKRITTQNIVIGGLAGAAPPLLGWTAVTNHIAPEALLLVLIIFVWTPPHFWALALHRLTDYQKIDIPMFPVIYGERLTKLHVLLYVLLLTIVTLLPVLIGMSGQIYFLGMFILNARFMYWAIILYRQKQAKLAISTFKYSIYYLFGLFVLLLVDHYY